MQNMETIKEDFVCGTLYDDVKKRGYHGAECELTDDTGQLVKGITYQCVLKWLRRIHKIYVMIDRSFSVKNGWHYAICVDDDFDNILYQDVKPGRSPEEATESAIRRSLLIIDDR